jgi:hypothetical protein
MVMVVGKCPPRIPPKEGNLIVRGSFHTGSTRNSSVLCEVDLYVDENLSYNEQREIVQKTLWEEYSSSFPQKKKKWRSQWFWKSHDNDSLWKETYF